MSDKGIESSINFYHETQEIDPADQKANNQIDVKDIEIKDITADEIKHLFSVEQQQIEKPAEALQSIDSDVQEKDMLSMIDETNHLIKQKKYDEANTYLNRIMTEYEKIDQNHLKKRELYYEILGLKNEIK